jgi:hypothetical protein
MSSEDFGYTYDGYGYMITYMGKNIGGAGTATRNHNDFKTHRESAEVTWRQCLKLNETRPFDPEKYNGSMWNWFNNKVE